MSHRPSCPFVIEGPIKLKISIVDIDRLHHHEELVPGFLSQLAQEIERDGYLKHPVIVDERTLVVLDGTHRVEALKTLGCKRVVVCLIDYEDPRVSLGCWYRTLKGSFSFQELLGSLREELGLEIEFSDDLRPEEVGIPPVALGLTDGKSYARVLYDFEEKCKAWGLVKKVETALRRRGLEIGFEVEEDALRKLVEGSVDAVLMTPRITKRDVVKTALSGRVFPHKTTRHVIPARPLFVNIPLGMLREDRPLEELDAQLKRMLEARRIVRLPPGRVIEGRRYEEEVFLLE